MGFQLIVQELIDDLSEQADLLSQSFILLKGRTCSQDVSITRIKSLPF